MDPAVCVMSEERVRANNFHEGVGLQGGCDSLLEGKAVTSG
jgi:hypothetical protein